MLNVTFANFEAEVITASLTTPVLIDFWAPWCAPCQSLGPLLEKIETAYAGRFKLVKINADEEQQLGAAFGIRSLPTCILLLQGQPVDGFTGALPESQIKAFLDQHVPPATPEAAQETAEVAEAQAPETDPDALLQTWQDTLEANPSDAQARFEVVKGLLARGQHAQAQEALAPALAQVGARGDLPRPLAALQRWLDAIDFVAKSQDWTMARSQLDEKIAGNRRDFAARFDKARGHMAAQEWTEALDELLEILIRDKAWSDDLARKTYIAVLDILQPPPRPVADGHIPPEDPTLARYRRQLSSVVLS